MEYGGQIYTSTNSGATWVAHTVAGAGNNWYSITSSADGTKLAVVDNLGYIYISNNSGSTWTPTSTSTNWYSITSSADGTKLFAVDTGGYIYTYTNPFPTLSVDIISPLASSTFSSWTPYVSWGISTSCYYSYDNFTSTSTANCSSNGSDIIGPPAGTSTLSVRGTYATSTVTNSVTFSYTPYYWCGTANSNWNNASNWYTSSSCSVNIGSVPGASNGAVLVGSISPVVGTSTSVLPFLINSTGLTGPANTVGIIFASSTVNTTSIVGNATFNGTAYNTGNIAGTAYFNTASAGTFTLSGNMIWGGSISGTIKGGDNVSITHLIFNNNSSNSTTINGMTSVFNNTASNNGIINGDATFNGTTFRMGTVNGTSTLNGISQTISGINNVVNFFKNLFTQLNNTGRDTLTFTSGSILNVSGLFTLLGTDADNLLSVRSTNPGSSASIGINGSSTIDFLRIKDIQNTGANIDLSSKTAYDDGGNSGFTFKPNSTPGSRGGNTGNHVSVILPISHGGIPPSNGNTTLNSSPSHISSERTLANLQTITLPINVLPKLNLTTLPTFGGTTKNSFSFISPIENFITSPSTNDTLSTIQKSSQSLSTFLTNLGIVTEQTITSLNINPQRLTATNIEGLFTVKGIISKLTGDKTDPIYQKVTTQPNKTITISLIPTNNKLITGTFNNQPITFNKDNTITITAPSTPGTYYLKTTSSPIPLAVVVTKITPAPEPTIPTKPITLWSVVWNWFTGR